MSRLDKVLLFLVAFVGAMILCLAVWGQTPSPYKPSEIQLLKLQLKQRDLWLAQRDAIEAQRRYQAAVQLLAQECETVKKENAWPDEVKCNGDTLEFSVPPPAPAK